MNSEFARGLKNGFPICLGYFFVSFGIGIMASRSGMSPWVATLISLTNLTSAGQAAGIGVIAASGSYIEMVLTQLLINCRYSLMGLSLSQNLDKSFTTAHRAAVSFGITDEIFGVASSEKKPLKPSYMYGMIFIATLGWTLGTLLGGICGDILPPILTNALGIMLYGMFIAIIIPPVRESLNNLAVVLLAAAVSCVIYFGLPQISAGFSIIISAVIASVVMAILRPIPDEDSMGDDEEDMMDGIHNTVSYGTDTGEKTSATIKETNEKGEQV